MAAQPALVVELLRCLLRGDHLALADVEVFLALQRGAAAAGGEPARALFALAAGGLARLARQVPCLLVARALLLDALGLLANHRRGVFSPKIDTEHPSAQGCSVKRPFERRGVLAGVFWGVLGGSREERKRSNGMSSRRYHGTGTRIYLL